MPFASWSQYLTDSEGNALEGVTASIVKESDGTTPTLYSDRAGNTEISTVSSDSNGLIKVYLAGGLYKITLTYGGTDTVLRNIPVGTAAEYDLPVPVDGEILTAGTDTYNLKTLAELNIVAQDSAGDTYIQQQAANYIDDLAGTHDSTTALGGNNEFISVDPASVSSGEITAGTETAKRSYSPADIKAFVDQHASAAGGLTLTDDANTTVALGDSEDGTHRRLTSDSAITATLQAAATAGTRIGVTKAGSGAVSIACQAPQSGGAGAGYFVPGDDMGGSVSTAGFDVTGYGEFLCVVNSDGDSAVWVAYGQTDLASSTDGSHSFGASVDFAGNTASDAVLKDTGQTVNALGNQSGAVTANYQDGQTVTVTLTGNATSLTISNPPASGTEGWMTFIIDHGSGPFTWAHPSGITWASGAAPTLSDGANEISIVTYVTTDGGTTWRGFFGGEDFS